MFCSVFYFYPFALLSRCHQEQFTHLFLSIYCLFFLLSFLLFSNDYLQFSDFWLKFSWNLFLIFDAFFSFQLNEQPKYCSFLHCGVMTLVSLGPLLGFCHHQLDKMSYSITHFVWGGSEASSCQCPGTVIICFLILKPRKVFV